MRASGFVVDCGGKDGQVSFYSDVRKINSFGGDFKSKFDGRIEVTKEINKLIQLIQGHLSHFHTVICVPSIHCGKYSSIKLPDLVFSVTHKQSSTARAYFGANSNTTILVKVTPVKLKGVKSS